MKKHALLTSMLLAMMSCEQWTAPLESNAFKNSESPPMSMSPVTAADYGGSLPVVSILCPDAGEEIKAEDIRVPVAALLAQHEWALSDAVVEYEFTDVPATPFVVGPPNTFSGNTWTDSSVTLDVPDAIAGDDLKIDVWGNWQLNALGGGAGPGDVVGKLRVQVIEDVDVTPTPFEPAGIGIIYDDGGSLSLPHNEPYTLHVRHRITNPGKARVTLQVRSEDIVGGSGTATLVLMFSARLDVSHHRRSVP